MNTSKQISSLFLITATVIIKHTREMVQFCLFTLAYLLQLNKTI